MEQRENPTRANQRSFLETHALRFAREGYALPDLELVSMGDMCRLSWRAGLLGPYDVEFLTSGVANVATAAVRSALADFIDRVVSRLLESGVEGTLLQDEWQAIQELGGEEAAYCAALASVGLDPFSADEEASAAVAEAYASLPHSLVRELAAITDGADIAGAATTLSEVLTQLDAADDKLRGLIELREALRPIRAELVRQAWRVAPGTALVTGERKRAGK